MDDKEYQRLKDLIDSGRSYHYKNFIFSSLIAVLLLKDHQENIKLFLDISFPIKHLIVFLYIITIAFTIITLDAFSSAWEKVSVEFVDEVPFNWFVLTGKKNKLLSGIWLILPWMVSSIAVGNSSIEIDKGSLIMLGLFFIAFPSYLKDFAFKVANKVDDVGNKITFSIYMLYWYRLARNIMLIFIPSYYLLTYFNVIVETPNKWITYLIWLLLVVTYVIRFFWGFAFIYKPIDKYGVRFGFSEDYKQ